VHIRGPHTTIGRDCIVGEKSHIAYGVTIGDRCKLNAFVYLCTGVTLGTGVMVSARVTFTNDRYPRATTGDLTELASSDPDEHTLNTHVDDGATIGAAAVIGPGITIGRFAMVGMASVVTRSVPPHHLVIGSPARTTGAVCSCGEPIARAVNHRLADGDVQCPRCSRTYRIAGQQVELTS
jgi:UDP-2-acetamido-3-amino-2,3-dideoxy-glucuronate N-acetyltransferase